MKYSRQLLLFSAVTIFATCLLSIGIRVLPVKKSVKQAKKMTEEAWVNEQLSKLSTDEKIAQSFMIACWSNKGKAHLDEIGAKIVKHKIGGIIFFQGEKDNLMDAISLFQSSSNVPLLMGLDGEWGAAMRIFGQERFPFSQTIGAANNPQLTTEMGTYMGYECNEMGIHINFSPVADVNSNPNNPVIGFRSFGANPDLVAKHVSSYVKGLEATNVLSCLKHFPGHGDTDKDSHLELPTVSHTIPEFEATDFVPFEAGIDAGASAVMLAHLNVPSLDDSGLPSSLSKKVIQTYLRKKMNFKGLVISDALNMKAVADKYGKVDVVVKAYIAGCDILLFPENIGDAIQAIRKKVDSGDIELTEIDARCKQVLRAKYKAIINKPMIKRAEATPARTAAFAKIYEKAITVIKNDHQVLPLNRLDKKIARISVGPNSWAFKESLDRYAVIDHYHYLTIDEALDRLKTVDLESYETILVGFHGIGQRASNNYGFGEWQKVTELLPLKAEVITTFFGNPLVLVPATELPATIDACVMAYENADLAQDRVGQFIMGAFDVNCKLQMTINDSYKKGHGLPVKGNGRLKFTTPEEIGVSAQKLKEIDDIVLKGIEAKAFPGCQILVAIKGKVIYQKSFGTTTYENGDSITNNHLYDIASITKIASSTMSLMKLKSEGKFDEKSNLGTLVPELVANTPYANLVALDMLTHQAGLTPWIPFYKKTLENGELKPIIYTSERKEGYVTQVADNIWIQDSYWKTMLNAILSTPLGTEKKYEYSDLGYYFFKAYIERVSETWLDQYVQNELYKPLGLHRITYLPLRKFNRKEIVPTEKDKDFRKQVIHGYVHDPGAAMVGGVGGHAGLFSNATDLAALMQVLLNKGQVGSYSLINPEVVEQFTACQFCPKNRRGIGFDKPTLDRKGGPTCDNVSLKSFGHSGFTGTLAWADPEFGVNFVFLSNRVYPDADNWKITKMGIRTEIQRVIYEALPKANTEKIN